MKTSRIDEFKANIGQIEYRIDQAARRVQRDASEVKLVVVTKTHPVEKILDVIEAGARWLGENYADEAAPKIEAIHGPGIEWHMIGHIQSRKAELVCKYFSYVHSLDSLKLARRLSRLAIEMDRVVTVLLECNASGEITKYGWDITYEKLWESLLPEIEEIASLPNVRVEGLMTMAPYTNNPEEVRPVFVKLRLFQNFLRKHLPHYYWNELSMGMSGDFEVAVEEGATWVRIGTSIMGPRE